MGLRSIGDDPFALVFDAHGATLRVTKLPEFTPARHTVLGWSVADIRVEIDDLNRKGVVFERYEGLTQDAAGIWTSPSGAKVAWFKDPGGNVLSLTESP